MDDYITNSAFLINNLLQLFPFSFLFMRFINYWSICSIYFMVDVNIPNYLKEILKMISEGVNGSIFEFLKIKVSFFSEIEEKY